MKKNLLKIYCLPTLLLPIATIFAVTSCNSKRYINYSDINTVPFDALVGQYDSEYYTEFYVDSNVNENEFSQFDIIVTNNGSVSYTEPTKLNNGKWRYKLRVSWTDIPAETNFVVQFWNDIYHERLYDDIGICQVIFDIPPNPITYIKDRSFSIKATLKYTDPKDPLFEWRVMEFGTGWIMSDATKGDTSDYEYYLATSWSFINSSQTLEDKIPEGCIPDPNGVYYSYCNMNALDEGEIYIDDINDFIDFESDEFVLEDEENFVFDSTFANDTPAIDFYVCKANFDNCPILKIRKQLDTLNALSEKGEPINSFAFGDDTEEQSKTKYVAGYWWVEMPNTNAKGLTWQCKVIEPSNQEYKEYGEDVHYIGTEFQDPSDFPYYDYSNHMVTKQTYSTDEMWDGATGSMLLTDDFKVFGSMWPDMLITSVTYIPRFSILKTSQYDFVSKW